MGVGEGKRGQGSREGEKKRWLPTKDENEGGHQTEAEREKRQQEVQKAECGEGQVQKNSIHFPRVESAVREWKITWEHVSETRHN